MEELCPFIIGHLFLDLHHEICGGREEQPRDEHVSDVGNQRDERQTNYRDERFCIRENPHEFLVQLRLDHVRNKLQAESQSC